MVVLFLFFFNIEKSLKLFPLFSGFDVMLKKFDLSQEYKNIHRNLLLYCLISYISVLNLLRIILIKGLR